MLQIDTKPRNISKTIMDWRSPQQIATWSQQWTHMQVTA